MFLDDTPLDEIDEAVLKRLEMNGVREGQRLDYKRDSISKADNARKEFLRDVSAMANAEGGYILLGIEEDGDGSPKSIDGIPDLNADQEEIRLQQMIDDGLEPTLSGARIRSVVLTNQNNVIILSIPKSWAQPHMVTLKGDDRFYIRKGNMKVRMSVTDLRRSFSLGMLLSEQIRDLREKRLEVLDTEVGDTLGVYVTLAGQLVVHLVPYSAFDFGHWISLGNIETKHPNLGALAHPLNDWRPNADGFILFRSSTRYPEVDAYAQLFNTGVVELVMSGQQKKTDNDVEYVECGVIGSNLVKKVRNYLAIQRECMGINPPVSIMISLLQCQDCVLHIDQGISKDSPKICKDKVLAPPVVLQDHSHSLEKTMKPALDTLWNAAGYAECPYYDEDGNDVNA